MKTIRLASCAIAVIAGIGLSSSARAEGSFHFPVGIAYDTGGQSAENKLWSFYQQDGYTGTKIDIGGWGLVFSPYYEWQTSIGGIGAGVTVGPTSIVTVEQTDYGYGESSDNVTVSYAVPVGPFIRYSPWPNATFSPYLRAGVKYVFAGGNYGSSDVGVSGAVGVELWRTKKIGMSLEAGYDTSEIKVTEGVHSSNVTFPGFTVSLSVLF